MDFEESGSQSLLVIMASKNLLPSILESKFFAVESNFLCLVSILACYVKSTVVSPAKKTLSEVLSIPPTLYY